MTRYRVRIPWTNAEGEHEVGDPVELNPDTPAEQVEVDRLISYGIIAVESEEDSQDEPESTPARRRAAKK